MSLFDEEAPTWVERIAQRVCGWRGILGLAVVTAAWILFNSEATPRGFEALDPFPYRWLQRTSILVNGFLVFVCLRAREDRRARHERQLRKVRIIHHRLLVTNRITSPRGSETRH